MQRFFVLCAGLAVLLVAIVATAETPASGSADEQAKIEFLIKAVGASKLSFVRNGTKFDSARAVEHLRGKWQAAGGDVRTARRFIEVCAAASSTTGEAYDVILADGKTRMPCKAWLETVLFAHELTCEVQPAPSTSQTSLKAIDALLAELGNDNFATRENATKELIRRGSAVKPALEKLAKETKDEEVAHRCRRILASVGNTDATAVGVLRYIENSGATFLRPGGSRTNLDGQQFSAHLQGKAMLMHFSLTGSAKEFIERIASTSSSHGAAYRVKFPDGREQDVKDWLAQRFK